MTSALIIDALIMDDLRSFPEAELELALLVPYYDKAHPACIEMQARHDPWCATFAQLGLL